MSLAKNKINTSAAIALSFGAGALFSSLIRLSKFRKTKKSLRLNAGATVEGNDLSLFYDDKSVFLQPTIPQKRKFLPAEFYGDMVRNCVVCCVDIVLVRTNPMTNKKECLLVERGTEPVKGVWWWPGGRMFKGETFFDTALRKMREETGIESTDAKCIQVLGVYNTFFPTSAWDREGEMGTQTVNPIVLVVLPQDGKSQDVLLDKTSERFKWMGLDPDEAEANGEDRYVVEGLRRLATWNETHGSTDTMNE